MLLYKCTTEDNYYIVILIYIFYFFRYFATGNPYSHLQYGFRVAPNTCGLIVRQIAQALIDVYPEAICTPDTAEGWKDIANLFQQRWNYPNCIGAMDGKHIAIKKPPGTGKEFFNYKKFCSIVMLAIIDADYKFIWVDIGANGAASDAQIWNSCEFNSALANDYLPLPPPEPLPHDTEPVPYHLIADEAFALSTTLMKPYGKRRLTREEHIFNYRLSRARRVSENAFGLLVNKWRCTHFVMGQDVKNVQLIVHACCILHNIVRDRYPHMHVRNMVDREDQNHVQIPGDWRQHCNLNDMHRVDQTDLTKWPWGNSCCSNITSMVSVLSVGKMTYLNEWDF